MKSNSLYILFAIVLISCSKNPDIKDNPDIESFTINQTTDFTAEFYPVSTTSPIITTVDIDKDGIPDVQLTAEAVFLTAQKAYHSWIEVGGIQNEIYFTSSLQTFPDLNIQYFYIASLNLNAIINDETGDDLRYNYTYIGSEYIDSLSNKIHIGALRGNGDKYLGFKFKKAIQNSGTMHYGWIKLNVSADNKIVTIKEVAYHKTPNTPINAGEK